MSVLVVKGTTERVYAGAELRTFRGELCRLDRVVVEGGGGTSGKLEVTMLGNAAGPTTRTFYPGVVGLEFVEEPTP